MSHKVVTLILGQWYVSLIDQAMLAMNSLSKGDLFEKEDLLSCMQLLKSTP